MLIYTFSYRLVQLLNGPLPCMKVLQLVFISLFSGLTRGNGQTYRSWVNWEARCQRCTALTRQGQGIFCANFGAPVLGLPLCHKAWCAGCYCQRRGTHFSVYTGSDPTTVPNAAEESGYFTSARPGDSFFFFFLNVMNVLSSDSRVFLAEPTTKITRYFLILFDALIWMLFGRVFQELLLNLQ
jgi:hypothetical protein